jgi:hypothetical protein
MRLAHPTILARRRQVFPGNESVSGRARGLGGGQSFEKLGEISDLERAKRANESKRLTKISEMGTTPHRVW